MDNVNNNEVSLRVDKNIAFNVLEFDKIADRQTAIILKALVVYFSKAFQQDLFGYEQLDPYHFAKEMNLDRATLFKRHPNPKYIEVSQLSRKQLEEREKASEKFDPDARVWDSYLENALYLLFSTPLFENYKGVTENQDYVGLTNFLILRDISICAVNTNSGRNQKIYYKYKLDDYFERNLRKYFVQINIKTFNACKDKGVEGFYLQLINIYQNYKTKGINIYHWKLNDLLQYFTISNTLEIKYQKRKLTTQLKKVEKLIGKSIPGLKFDWIAGDGQRWKYVPMARWDQPDLDLIKQNDFKALDDVFLKHLKRNLLDIFRSQLDEPFNQKTQFFKWLIGDDGEDIKISSYISTYSLYRKVQSFPSPKTIARSFFNKLKKAKNENDIDRCFRPPD